MSLKTRIIELVTTIKTETKALRTFISGANNGDIGGLTTTATNLVDAINEVKATADSGASVINDTTASGTSTYSSTKVDQLVAAGNTSLKDEILGGVAPELDTLIELATKLGDNETSDAALVAVVANKANASDVYTQAEIGDPDTDFVALWNNA